MLGWMLSPCLKGSIFSFCSNTLLMGHKTWKGSGHLRRLCHREQHNFSIPRSNRSVGRFNFTTHRLCCGSRQSRGNSNECCSRINVNHLLFSKRINIFHFLGQNNQRSKSSWYSTSSSEQKTRQKHTCTSSSMLQNPTLQAEILQAILLYKTYHHGITWIPIKYVVPIISTSTSAATPLPIDPASHQKKSGSSMSTYLNSNSTLKPRSKSPGHSKETKVPLMISAPPECWPRELQGLPLGKYCQTLREEYRKGSLSQDWVHELNALKFGWDFSDYKFYKQTLPALETYRRLYGHLLVPIRSWIIPFHDSTWPSETWGLNLGRLVDSLRTHCDALPRKRIQCLNELGFVWNAESHIAREKILPALETYKRLYNDLLVPQNFVVPWNDAEWPSTTWGCRLGYIVSRIRSKVYFASIRKELDALGFMWGNAREYQTNMKMLAALQAYQSLHGHFLVPSNFIVPLEENIINEAWPSQVRGYKLGQAVHALRKRKRGEGTGGYAAVNSWLDKKLNEIGFQWEVDDDDDGNNNNNHDDNSDSNSNSDDDEGDGDGEGESHAMSLSSQQHSLLVQALRIYRSIYGDLLVPSKFTIPSTMDPNKNKNKHENKHKTDSSSSSSSSSDNQPHSMAWPLKLQGFSLGQQVHQVRKRQPHLDESVRQELNELGFVWNVEAFIAQEKILPALQTFVHLFGHALVPQSFVIPVGEDPWPRATWALRLGRYVERIRSGRQFTCIRNELDALGFVWEGNVDRFMSEHKVLPALQTYLQLNGDLVVPRSFVVPDQDDRWPRLTWKMRLGVVVNNIRTHGHHERIHASLNALGFVWNTLTRSRESNNSTISSSTSTSTTNTNTSLGKVQSASQPIIIIIESGNKAGNNLTPTNSHEGNE